MIGVGHAAVIAMTSFYYPSAVRSTGGGWASFMAKFAAVAAPIVGGYYFLADRDAVLDGYNFTALCLAGAVLVGFEERNEKLFFWLGGALFVVGSIADILDGALARAASKGTVFGAFLDSPFDRLGEAAMLAAIGLVFMRDGNEIALVATFAAVIGSFLVSYTRAKAEALGLRGDVGFGSRVVRVVLIAVGLGLAPWGWLQWPIYALTEIVWVTVCQRMLFVRRQLRELAEAS
jgi:phosphatidylglycerophosphate synthase